jgi:hypothetical protein
MAKVLCAHSGIEFNVSHFPISLTQNELSHPIFYVPLKRLWKFLPKWQAGELDSVDSYLLYLSLLQSTELVEFRTAAIRHAHTDSIISQNMESLYDCIGRIVSIRNLQFVLPRFVITPDTRNLSNTKHWIALWNDAYADYCTGLKDQNVKSKLQKREAALERLIKNPAIRPERYSHLLANWASIAGEFPTSQCNINGNTMSISEYWQSIIQACYTATEVIQIPRNDLYELLEHCEEYIDLGSIFSYQLFNTLREGLQTIDGFFSIGSTQFSILSNDSDVGASNLQLLIDNAPVSEPNRMQYPNEFAFLKAKMNWAISQSQSVVGETK